MKITIWPEGADREAAEAFVKEYEPITYGSIRKAAETIVRTNFRLFFVKLAVIHVGDIEVKREDQSFAIIVHCWASFLIDDRPHVAELDLGLLKCIRDHVPRGTIWDYRFSEANGIGY